MRERDRVRRPGADETGRELLDSWWGKPLESQAGEAALWYYCKPGHVASSTLKTIWDYSWGWEELQIGTEQEMENSVCKEPARENVFGSEREKVFGSKKRIVLFPSAPQLDLSTCIAGINKPSCGITLLVEQPSKGYYDINCCLLRACLCSDSLVISGLLSS